MPAFCLHKVGAINLETMAEFTDDKSLSKLGNGMRRTAADTPVRMLDKVQPQATILEEAVLGSMMLDKEAVAEVIDILKAESFYLEKHQHIFAAITELFGKGMPVNILTVTEQLRKMGKLDEAGGPVYITMLTNRVGSTANVEHHARIVAQKHILRELIKSSTDIIKGAYEETTDVFDLLDQAEQSLFNITDQNLRRKWDDMSNLIAKAIKQLKSLKDHKEEIIGVPSGLLTVDRITAGWQPSDLVIVAARPSMGKCLGKGTKVLLFDGSLRKVEDIQVGDLLMGDNSTPRRVLSIARGQERMYWVHQNKGISYRVNESHILSLKRSRNSATYKKGEVLNISVRDYLTKSDKFKTNYKGYKVAVKFPAQAVPLDPYFLGLWLGDGHNYSSRITNTDPEVIDYLKGYADELNLYFSTYEQVGRTNNYAITTGQRGAKVPFNVQEQLRGLNLLENKHLPQPYLINSTENRLKLLAGLIDSDGHYQEAFNCYEITQKNKQLAEQMKFLCELIGFPLFAKRKTSHHCVAQLYLNGLSVAPFRELRIPFPYKLNGKKPVLSAPAPTGE